MHGFLVSEVVATPQQPKNVKNIQLIVNKGKQTNVDENFHKHTNMLKSILNSHVL